MRTARSEAVLAVLLAALLLPAAGTRGQEAPDRDALFRGRPISVIRLEGLNRVMEQEVWNNVRAAVGDPYDTETVKDDLRRLDRLGQFKYITQEAELEADGSVSLVYRFVEQPIVTEIQVSGNKLIPDQDLLAVVRLRRGGPRDDFQIQNARRAMESLYRDRGHYLTTVTIDERELEETGILLFQVIEGPRVRVRDLQFEGNEAFRDEQLSAQVRTRTYFAFVRKGQLDEQQLIDDVAALDDFYKQRGFLDVRVDRTIDLSPDSREAKVTFLVAEGRQYRLRRVQTNPPRLEVFAAEQVAAMLTIKAGDVYSQDRLRESLQIVQDHYGRMGYLDATVRAQEIRVPKEGLVDLWITINEGQRSRTGLITITGNFLTRDKVIRRETRLAPGRPLDATEIEETTQRIRDTRLFSDVDIAVQEPDPRNPQYRDVIIEVKERNTGAVNFGVAVGSDAGVFGEISVNQTNFDIMDLPQSFDELIRGKAFRGAGQTFNMTIRPGDELFQYFVSITEPHLLESEYSLKGTAGFRERVFDQYDERRISVLMGLGRRVGEVWQLGLNGRAETVELDDIEPSAPVEVFEDAGPNNITSVGVTLTRSTLGRVIRPPRGSRLELSLEQVGALAGDFTFTAVGAEYTVFFTLAEDFLGRKSILKLNARTNYILQTNEAPVYEKYYLGGRSFRGFEFRTVSPKGVRADTGEVGDDPIGGEWLFFAGAEYEIPLIQETMTLVTFLDTGTVTEEPAVDEWRASIGAGMRLYIEQLGPVPLAFDFAYPFLKQDGDEEQVFSFGVQLPFN